MIEQYPELVSMNEDVIFDQIKKNKGVFGKDKNTPLFQLYMSIMYKGDTYLFMYLDECLEKLYQESSKRGIIEEEVIDDIHDEINNLLASGATLTALTGDPDGYTYKVETSTPTPPPTPIPPHGGIPYSNASAGVMI